MRWVDPAAERAPRGVGPLAAFVVALAALVIVATLAYRPAAITPAPAPAPTTRTERARLAPSPSIPSATITPAPTASELPMALPSPAGITPAAAASAPQPYVVQAGDTLLGIALAHGVSIGAIQIANDMVGATMLYADQELLIPAPRAGELPTWSAYTLVPGDTLYDLAARFSVPVEDLLQANGLSLESVLVVGQALLIPTDTLVDAGALAGPPTPTVPPPSPAPPAEETGTPAASPPGPSPTVPPAGGGNEEWAAVLTALINQARADNGVQALAYNDTLALAAQGHANDCSARGWCSHVGSDGADLYTRLLRAGYVPLVAWGENWAWDRDVYSTFSRWFDEPPGADPHRRNILSTRYREIGIGIAPAYAGGWFFIADFGSRGG